MSPTPVLAGLAVALASALAAELCWRLVRPRTMQQASACWVGGIFLRLVIALAGLAICIGLYHLAAPPLVASMAVGYMALLAFETRVTLKRMRNVPQRAAQHEP
jgi:hypothetical protein